MVEKAGRPRVIILMGVSGCGKTTIGQQLAKLFDWAFIEGDNFHPKENIQKMADGIPLTDSDRQPWLETLHNQLITYQKDGRSAILACSALKKKYRQTLRGNLKRVNFVYLKGDFDMIQNRMRERAHFMKADMLKSQFYTLEEPIDAFAVDISESAEVIVQKIAAKYKGATC